MFAFYLSNHGRGTAQGDWRKVVRCGIDAAAAKTASDYPLYNTFNAKLDEGKFHPHTAFLILRSPADLMLSRRLSGLSSGYSFPNVVTISMLS